MSELSLLMKSSIGKKLLMALTGIFLITFLPVHLAGNLLLIDFVGGREAFNEYAEFMGHNPLIRVMEIVLFLGFFAHIGDGISLMLANKSARPSSYAQKHGSETSKLSAFMPHTAIIILVFLVLHLVSFWFVARLGIDISLGANPSDYFINGELSLYDKTRLLFAQPWYGIINLVAMIVVGLHLVHGFQSAFQTLGLMTNKYAGLIKGVGLLYAILVPLGFVFISVYFLING